MPRNKKPRKKFTCRKIEIPRISEERIDVIIDTMTNVGFSVELKLPNGTFDRDDMRALADFSNLTGVTFSELGEDRLSEEDLISSNELQCALSDSLTSLYLRTYKNKAKFYVPTGDELKTRGCRVFPSGHGRDRQRQPETHYQILEQNKELNDAPGWCV